ncbi:MAG: HlyD family efflux transporter periplasmic adaptor subunit [Magnetococcales bacterium]|nr:HlyD family efflux transporter periplasmic adaptor subunit [Magnetococcales bacterium]
MATLPRFGLLKRMCLRHLDHDLFYLLTHSLWLDYTVAMNRIFRTLLISFSTLLFAVPSTLIGDTDTSPEALLYGAVQSSGLRALLHPKRETTLASQMGGRILRLTVRNGERFEAWQPLVVFDCEINEARLKKSAAGVKMATKKHEANLMQKQYGSVGDLEVGVSEAELEETQAELAIQQAQVKMCQIAAPYPGRVIKTHVHSHQSVPSGEPLLDILDDSELVVKLYVPSPWLRWLKTNTSFMLSIDETGKRYPARIRMFGAAVDPASHTIEVSAEIEGKHSELLSGMSGTAHFKTP